MKKEKDSEDLESKAMTGRNTQVARVFAIMSLLENHPRGLTVSQIYQHTKEAYKGTERTIRRDLDLIIAAGFPLAPENESPESKSAIWKLDRKTKIGDYLVLDSKEILGLYFARNALSPLRETPFFQDLARLFSKIESKLSVKHSDHLKEIDADFHFEPGPAWGLGLTPDVIDSVRSACSEGQYLKCEYSSANSQTVSDRKIGPHFIYYAKGALYLLGEDTKDGLVKVFSLARMKNVEMLDEEYSGAKTDPEDYFKNSMGMFRGNAEPEEVKILFAPTISPFVKERTWHNSQTVLNRQGGAIELGITVTVTPELINWILGFGAGATVIAPPHLKVKMQEAASRILDNYAAKVKKAG